MASWPCSVRPWATKTMQCEPATRRCGCSNLSKHLPLILVAGRPRRSRSGSGCIRARSSSDRSETICTWTTRPWARRRTLPHAWSNWRHRARSSRRLRRSDWPRGSCTCGPSVSGRSRGSNHQSPCSRFSDRDPYGSHRPAGARIHLQARAHARRGVRERAPQPPSDPPCGHHRGDGDIVRGTAGRTGRASRASRLARGGVGQGSGLPPSGGHACRGPLGESRRGQ